MSLKRSIIIVLAICLHIHSNAFADEACSEGVNIAKSIKCGKEYPNVNPESNFCPESLAEIIDVDLECKEYSYCILYNRTNCPMKVEAPYLPFFQPVYSDADIPLLLNSKMLNVDLKRYPELIPTKNTTLITVPKTATPMQIQHLRLMLSSSIDCTYGTGEVGFCPETSVNPFNGIYTIELFKSDPLGEPLKIPVRSDTFKIDNNTFLPIYNPAEHYAITRSPIIDLSNAGFETDSQGPVYISVALQLDTADEDFLQIDNDNDRYNKLIYIPYAKTTPLVGEHSFDYIRSERDISDSYSRTDSIETYASAINSGSMEIKHFTAELSLFPLERIKKISACAELQNVTGGNIELGNNINCKDFNFSPIALTSPITLDGNGYTISNLYINKPNDNLVGLFQYLPADSNVSNIFFDNAHITGKDYVGTLSGRVGDNVRLERVRLTNSSSTISGSQFVGSISGFADRAVNLINLSANARVYGSITVGGLIGGLSTGYSNITRSYFIGDVNGSINTGGLVGGAGGSSYISESYARANVMGSTAVGGIAGNAAGGIIDNCFFDGNVNYIDGEIVEGSYVGGIVGQAGFYLSSEKIKNSYSTGYIAGNNYVGGMFGAGTLYSNYSNSFTVARVKTLSENDNLIGYGSGSMLMEYFNSNLIFYYYNQMNDDATRCMGFSSSTMSTAESRCTRITDYFQYFSNSRLNWNENIWEFSGSGLPRLRNVEVH